MGNTPSSPDVGVPAPPLKELGRVQAVTENKWKRAGKYGRPVGSKYVKHEDIDFVVVRINVVRFTRGVAT